MNGIVIVDTQPENSPRVAGMSVPLRALLALQAAGATELGFTGPTASRWVAVAQSDDRLRVHVEEFPTASGRSHVAVSSSLVIDTKTARELMKQPGVLFVGREVVAAHREATHQGHPLEDCGDGALDPSRFGIVMTVVDAQSALRAEQALFDGLRKPQDGMISRAINRSLSLRVTRYIAKTSLRPNQLSVGILSFGVAGAWLAAHGTHLTLLIAGICFNTQSILDGCDGELARLTFRGSRTGEWIDTLGDDFTNYGFFAGASVGLYRNGMGTLPLMVGGIGLGVGLIASLTEYRYLVRIGSGDLLKYPLGFGNDGDGQTQPETGLKKILGLARPLFKRDFFVFLTMLCCFGGPWSVMVMLVLFAFGACATCTAVMRSEWSRRGVDPRSAR
jgi:hypothetical protein